MIFPSTRPQSFGTPEQRRSAYLAVAAAKRSGILVREPCFVCGHHKSEAHHEDYDRPLEVIWLCRMHHYRRHTGESLVEMVNRSSLWATRKAVAA